MLVQFGMDTLLAGKQLVHVTFDLHSSNVISWYDGIFTELAKKKNIGNQIPPGANDPQNKHGFINSMIMGAAGRGGR